MSFTAFHSLNCIFNAHFFPLFLDESFGAQFVVKITHNCKLYVKKVTMYRYVGLLNNKCFKKQGGNGWGKVVESGILW